MKTQKFGSRSAAVLVAAMAVSGTAMVEEAVASSIVIDIQQVGDHVQATINGRLTRDSDMQTNWNGSVDPGIFGGNEQDSGGFISNSIDFSSTNAYQSGDRSYWLGGVAPDAGPWWGTTVTESPLGGNTAPNQSTTSLVGVDRFGMSYSTSGLTILKVNPEYFDGVANGEEGALISGTMTLLDRSMDGLGLQNVGQVFTYYFGPNTVTVNLLGSTSAVPGGGLISVASVGLAGCARRRRR